MANWSQSQRLTLNQHNFYQRLSTWRLHRAHFSSSHAVVTPLIPFLASLWLTFCYFAVALSKLVGSCLSDSWLSYLLISFVELRLYVIVLCVCHRAWMVKRWVSLLLHHCAMEDERRRRRRVECELRFDHTCSVCWTIKWRKRQMFDVNSPVLFHCDLSRLFPSVFILIDDHCFGHWEKGTSCKLVWSAMWLISLEQDCRYFG